MIARKHFVARRSMIAGPDLAAAAGLIGEPARAAMMSALLSGEAYPAVTLAAHAGVSPQTASVHLAKLSDAGLIKVARNGRYRFYRLGGPKIADALEALAAISPEHAIMSLHQSDSAAALKLARMCYDHLAGWVGVGITEALAGQAYIVPRGRDFRITKSGSLWLIDFGIDPESLSESRRKLATQCLDWSERRPHIGGALGAAIADHMMKLGWFARTRSNRSLKITEDGQRSLLRHFGIHLDAKRTA
jgi:DNA-binding transcriptional ArsR family regulator